MKYKSKIFIVREVTLFNKPRIVAEWSPLLHFFLIKIKLYILLPTLDLQHHALLTLKGNSLRLPTQSINHYNITQT